MTNTSDTGNGSLRQAIINANADTSSPTVISFQIPGNGPFTISPQSTYPPLSVPVTIDGTTQPGYSSTPLIQINGASIGSGSDCLTLSGGNSSVFGLSIYHSKRDGIRLSGSGTNTIQGCNLGVDATGTTNWGNADAGIYIYRSSYNTIGGTTAGSRNILSGNQYGIYVDDGPVPQIGTGNTIQGNYIGTAYSGESILKNTNDGIYLSQSYGNLIGGTTTGAGNVISGNPISGVFLAGVLTTNNVVAGNLIGTDATGTLILSNLDGVTLYGASANFIGGTTTPARNIISGNTASGVLILDWGVTNAINNVVAGNFIGTDINGRLALPNRTNGVFIAGTYGNIIGGVVGAGGNVISGNIQNGVIITQTGASNNVVAGNYIGTDVTGSNPLPNTYSGVTVSSVSGNLIGGTSPGAGNVISGNTQNGIYLQGSTLGSNIVQGNLIGTDASGHYAISNILSGIWIESSGNLIGGTTAGAQNVISGNFQSGLFMNTTATTNNIIQGNFIGVDISGTNALGNGPGGYYSGIYLTNASGNYIGGSAPGAGNIISGNGDKGISLNGPAVTRNTIQGNYIGTDVTGMHGIDNGNGGIYDYSSPTNYIGGTNAGAGNIISDNNADGIYVSATSGIIIQGNYIGTAADGTSALGNLWHNVEFQNNASNNTVGGNYTGSDNRIAYARTPEYDGVRIRPGCVGNRIYRNCFFSNGGGSPLGLGITEGNVGVTTNGLPVFSSAVTGNGTRLTGKLFSNANDTFLMQFYANVVTNLSGYGEGLTWLGQTNITTDATGNASFTVFLNTNVPAGQYIAATVTDNTNNTSEFSADILVRPPPLISLVESNYLAGVTSNYFSGLRTNPITHMVTTNAPGWEVYSNYAKQLYLVWPTNPPGFSVITATNLAPDAVWLAFTNQPFVSSNQFKLLIPSTNMASQFFQLKLP